MKAWIAAALTGLAGAGALHAQSPAFNMVQGPTVPRLPPPMMPDLPGVTNRAPAQLPGGSIPLPPPPLVGQPPTAGEPAGYPKLNSIDLNAAYAEPFEPPTPEPTIIEGEPFTAAGPGGPRFWGTLEGLLWWTKRGPQAPPLLVTGSPTDQFPGALDQPGTRVLAGGESFGLNPFAGIRGSAGIWFGPENRFGFEAAGFTLEQRSVQYRAGGTLGQPFLARPFIDARSGAENVFFTSQNFLFDPDRSAFMTGGFEASSNSKLWAYEFNGLYAAYRNEVGALTLLGGFRSVVLREKLTVGESLQNLRRGGGVYYLGRSLDPDFRLLTYDSFQAENTFLGGQLGARTHFQWGRWGIDLTGKAAIGVVQQLLEVNGLTAVDGPNGKVLSAVPGGVLAAGPALGRHFQQEFGIVPEGNIDVSYAITENFILKAGYSFLYMNSVMRAANQPDRTINPSFVPSDPTFLTPGGPARPLATMPTASFWAQGVNFAVELRY